LDGSTGLLAWASPYRVEITKAGETIPAKYNTASTLGAEVFLDVKEAR
jgi:hypothetical protein